jgi:16S rRNA processing protein RimM
LCSDDYSAVIGVVLSPHGVGGMVKVFPYTDYPERIKDLAKVMLRSESGQSEMPIEQASLYGRFWLIKFKDIDNRDQAAALRAGLLLIPLEQRVKLPEDSYYHDQLIGLQVVDLDQKIIGRVVELITTGGHDLLVVEEAGKMAKRFLIPVVKKFIRQVDCTSGKVVVDLPEGLLDL